MTRPPKSPRPPAATSSKRRAGDAVEKYARDVVEGRVVAGPMVRQACQRHLTDLIEGPKRGLKWDRKAARWAMEFFPSVLHLAQGEHAGKPFELQPWQKFIVGSLFGWMGADGHRRFRTAYLEIGKGNGKSPLAAGVGLYGLCADHEAAAEIYSAATTRDQAKIVWGDAQKMVTASPELRDAVFETVNNLAFVKTNSFFRPVSAEASTLDGLRPHIVLVDEVHEHPNDLVINKLRAGFKGRRQPLIMEITNSGWDRHSICWQHHDYSSKIVAGILENDSWFAYVCGLDEKDDWKNEAIWPKANPNLGVSVTVKYLREQVQEASEMPAKENIVRRLNFCEWTEQSDRLIAMEAWDRGAAPIDVAALEGRLCYAGLDFARISDSSSLCLLFPPLEPGGLFQVLMRYWVPEEDIRIRSERDRVPYQVWAREGLLVATPGNATDFGHIKRDTLELAGRFRIAELAYDRMFANSTIQDLQAEGMNVVEFGQGFLSMGSPTAELLRHLKADTLQHGGHPILRWNASNMAASQDAAGNLKPDKAKSRERIDGMVALIMALGRATVHSQRASVYETRGVRTLG